MLCIHARIGGGNWSYYDGPELSKQPWFIEKVDDAFDSTYCDIYAKIVYLNDSLLSLSRPDDSFEMNGIAYTGNTL